MRKADRADPLSGLAALDPGRRGRPTLPPSEAVQPYDETLADLLRASINADAEASQAAFAALDAEPGGVLWRAAVEAETERVADHLARHGSLPAVDDSSPLLGHLVNVRPDLVVRAYQAQAGAEWADRAVRDYARQSRRLADKLDKVCDDLEAEIQAEWEAAEATGLRGHYEAGDRLCRRWSAAAALFRWATAPDRAYKPPSLSGFPASLEYAEYVADVATGGKERLSPPVPPDEAAQLARYYTGGR
jgi:hypothetical protein